jgi:cytidyltransferase-like protein
MTKVLVTGCFDILHNGHIQFIENAAKYGDELYVGVCSDYNYVQTKTRIPIFNEAERLYMIKALKWVKDAAIATGTGKCDFENVVQKFKPDVLIVNNDQDVPEKHELCKKYGISIIVLNREKYHDELPTRSSFDIKKYIKGFDLNEDKK